jgi:hypothetical protein
MQALIHGGALTDERLSQAGNRSILIHALDSASPYMMAKAFLECGTFKRINKDFNLYTDGTYTYSPTKYIEKGKCRSDKTQNQSLITLLRAVGATDQYWKNEGPQPPDMTNPPSRIARAEEERLAALKRKQQEEEERRLRIEEEQFEIAAQRRRIALEQEAEQAKLEREEQKFKLRISHEQKMHAQQIAKQNDILRIKEADDKRALRQAASMSKLKNDENEAEHRRTIKFAQSQQALAWAFNQGVQAAGTPGGDRRALGMSSSKSNLNLTKRLGIEGPRIMEVDEE